MGNIGNLKNALKINWFYQNYLRNLILHSGQNTEVLLTLPQFTPSLSTAGIGLLF